MWQSRGLKVTRDDRGSACLKGFSEQGLVSCGSRAEAPKRPEPQGAFLTFSWDSPPSPALPCLDPPADGSQNVPQTHASCWHGPHRCPHWPAPAEACLAASPSGPFAGLEDVPSGLFSCEGNWERKARCEWNGSLWAQNKREGRQSDWKLAFLLNILQLQRAEATGKDQKTWDSWTGPLGLTELQFWTNSAVAERGTFGTIDRILSEWTEFPSPHSC